MSRYHLLFKKFQKNIVNEIVVFSIGNIKSRVPIVAYFVLHCYDPHGDEILVGNKPVYTGNRFVVTSSYREYVHEFELDEDILHNTFHFQFELVLNGVTSENPCYFNRIMFEEAPHAGYHKPEEAYDKANVNFMNNNYAELFKTDGTSLQVIRPTQMPFNTQYITASSDTILAPHLPNEPITDTADKLMMEYINQTEQSISFKR